MKLLPDPGPQRRRLFLMIGALVVTYVVLSKFAGGEPLPIPQTTGPAATSKPAVRASGPNTRANAQKKAEATKPVALKLKQFEEVPAEPEAGRNLFRFGVPPPPPQPKYTPPPTPPPPVYTPPPPPPIPPIPLTLTQVIPDPVVAGRLRAYLADKKSGVVFEAMQGQVVDGQYKLLAVGPTSVVMSYLDGTGQRTLTVGR
jgi:hypothetical protein